MVDKEKCAELFKVDLRGTQPYLTGSYYGSRVQLQMVRCPGNMPGLYRGRMECETCEPWREEWEEAPVCTQERLKTSRAYGFLPREHSDMETNFCTLTKYFMDLMWVRA